MKMIDIEGYEGLYAITDDGKVWSYHKKHYKDLQEYQKTGYKFVTLFKNSKGKIHLIHRLVAEAFIPNHENKTCIDHINTIRTDNRVENLRWCTHKENANNILTKKHLSDSRKGIKLSEETKQKMSESHKGKYLGKKNPFFGKHHTEEVKKLFSERMKKMINENLDLKKQYEENRKIAHRKMFKPKYQYDLNNKLVKIWDNYDEFINSDYNTKCVRRCCKGERKTYKGYIWSYTPLQ